MFQMWSYDGFEGFVVILHLVGLLLRYVFMSAKIYWNHLLYFLIIVHCYRLLEMVKHPYIVITFVKVIPTSKSSLKDASYS